MTTLTVTSNNTKFASIRNSLASHPFVAFFMLAFAGTWLFMTPIVLGQDGLGFLPYHVPFPIYVLLFLAGSFLGPTLAALAVTAALEGQAGVRHFLRRYGQWRVGVHWYLLFLIGFPAVYLVSATLWMGIEPWQALIQQWRAIFTVYLPAILVFPAIINWGEEAGWRGFAQTRMQIRYGAFVTCLLIGFLHGIWHLPVFLLVEGPPALGPFDLGSFLLNTGNIMILTIVWTWIFNGARQSILIASLMHATFNGTQALMGTLLPNLPQEVGYAVLTIIVLSAVLITILTNGRLGYRA